MTSRPAFPPEALRWLLGESRASVLLIGAQPAYARLLLQGGYGVTVADRHADAIASLIQRLPLVHAVVARPEALPFDPRCFDAVISVQNFHTVAPGLALGEWARVLKPEGHLALAYFSRDDTVPWVKRLRRLVQDRLPEAMRGAVGFDSVTTVADSTYFPRLEQKAFRIWVPSTKEALQTSAQQAQGADRLDEEARQALADEVGALYDEYARPPEPLQLPFQLTCWKALVDQRELSEATTPSADGLTITL
ncbi:MAG: class I SAM-dependent methyltransferase [Propionibacteriaceae bacterium]|jgi:SAM-dependent methyltransferase|nr:class I SAM-dependent methyltransferase [Propionibacteriaceae bacterium]